MRQWRGRSRITIVVVASMLAVGCGRAIEGHPVAAASARPDESQCTKVDAPLTMVPAAVGSSDDSEPTIRVPQPDGWERITKLDSAVIRFTMGNMAQGVEDFAASAVVTVESYGGEVDPDDFFRRSREALKSSFHTAEPKYTERTVCGLPAETVAYVIPKIGPFKRPVSATALVVIAFAGRKTYGVVLSIQSPRPDDADYERDEDTLLTGFQVFAPESGHR